jgi:hypothetical protein
MLTQPEETPIGEWLRGAIRESYERDGQLFQERAHERSIVFQIARRLAERVEAGLPGWSVDVDYDRWHPDAIAALKKRLKLVGEPDDSDVYPDIIVHRRTGSSADDNLLVVEVKKEEAVGRSRDIEKLQAFMRHPFLYQYALFVELPSDGGVPSLQWIYEEPFV